MSIHPIKLKAIQLRKLGFSYSEILKTIPVAKSTLSLWLRSVGLSKRQKQRLTDKKMASIKRGWEAWRQIRKDKTKEIKMKAHSEINSIIVDEKKLLLMGAMLYWAEGSKEKEYNLGQGIIFSNSDPNMIRLFLKWLAVCMQLPKDQITFDIYIHKNHEQRIKEVQTYWQAVTGHSADKFGKIYYKKHNLSTVRKNTGSRYFGLLRVRVLKSTHLNRKIAGWIEGICIQCGIV